MIVSILHPYDTDNRRRINTVTNAHELIDDLQLDVIFGVMANNDTYKADAARRIMLAEGGADEETILFRQAVLADVIDNMTICESMYAGLCKAIDAFEKYKSESKPSYSRFSPMANRVRDAAVLCSILLDCAEHTAKIFECGAEFASGGFIRMTNSFLEFYGGNFFSAAKEHISGLKDMTGASVIRYGVRPGPGFKGECYVMRSVSHDEGRKHKNLSHRGAILLSSVGLQAQALGLLDAGLSKLLRILNEINAHTLADLRGLRQELAFYLGGADLFLRLKSIGQQVSFPAPHAQAESMAFTRLADAALAINSHMPPASNSAELTHKRLVLITGANQGGKSTFLRSVGQALLMAKSGLFVTADSFTASLPGRLYTHFCRGENHTPDSGRLDEELGRMAGIIERITPDSILLMNESFSSTSEREGTWIAREILPALYERGVRIMFVTHLTDYAMQSYDSMPAHTAFLKAGRTSDGSRSFVISPGRPEPTSFGLDLYREMFVE